MSRRLLAKLPLRFSAPLLLGLPVVTVVAVLLTITLVQGRRAASHQARDQLLEIHDRINDRLGELLRTPARVNRVNADLIGGGRLGLGDLRAWRDYLFEQAQAFDMLSGIMFGGVDGRVVWMFRYPDKPGYEFGIRDEQTGEEVFEYRVVDGQTSREPVGRYSYDPRRRPWYREAAAAGKPHWTEYAWVNEDGSEITWGLALAEPCYDAAGQLVGVLDSELSLHDISQFLASLEIGRTGLVFLLDRNGSLVANSVGAAVENDQLERIPAVSSENRAIGTAAERVAGATPSATSVDGPYHDMLSVDGRRQLMVVSALDRDTGLDWRIVTVVPEEDFLAEVHAGWRKSLLVGLVAVLATLVLGVALAVASVRPILALVEHARRIGGGDLKQELHLDYSPEFVRLSEEINTMTAGLRDRMRMRQSLAVAMDVQQALLPSGAPQVQGLDIAGHSTYCDETGGDYYDFLEVAGLSESEAVIVVGDVMGHGVAAAMLMATARGILRSRSQDPGSLADLLTHLNGLLQNDTGGERFMTMLLMTIDTQRRELRWASAGHDPPIIYIPNQGQFVEFEGGGMPLGILEQQEYEERTVGDLQPMQLFFAATDGVWEMSNAAGEQFGKDRLRALLRTYACEPAETITDRLREELTRFRGSVAQDDDVTFVVARML